MQEQGPKSCHLLSFHFHTPITRCWHNPEEVRRVSALGKEDMAMLLEADCPARGFNWKSWASALALGLMVCISDIRLPGESDPAGETQSPEMLESVFASADFFTGDAEDARVAGMPTADFNPPREPMLLPYDRIIHEAAGRYDLDADLIAAVIMAESQFKPGAISKKGAKGLMQIMPDTAEALNLKNVYSPRENI
ncbi:MAG TPA: transglycosylase SLT domain-containing protein, partial [Methylomicrobium sp.]|nr:transglycosylase SLT domain-containing protein [Methylomicrobium sp.]